MSGLPGARIASSLIVSTLHPGGLVCLCDQAGPVGVAPDKRARYDDVAHVLGMLNGLASSA